MATYNIPIHRAITIPINETEFNKEINIIKQIAISNRYNYNLIDRMIKKKNKTKHLLKKPKQKTNTLEYIIMNYWIMSEKKKKKEKQIGTKFEEHISHGNLKTKNQSKPQHLHST